MKHWPIIHETQLGVDMAVKFIDNKRYPTVEIRRHKDITDCNQYWDDIMSVNQLHVRNKRHDT